MPRYIFTPSAVTTNGANQPVSFYDRATGGRRFIDLFTVDGSDNTVLGVSNGIIVAPATTGLVGSFAGPPDVSTVWLQVANSGSRTSVTAVRASVGSGGDDLSSTFAGLVAETVTYNVDGTVATSVTGGITTTFTYNADGTVATEARLGKTKTYSYDASGNVTGSVVA